MNISVIIPVYNESPAIRPLFTEVSRALERCTPPVNYEIIFVDDGSTDDTADAVLSIDNSKKRYVRMEKNSGKSSALQKGLNAANHNIIVLMDGDLQDDPSYIPEFLDVLNSGYDCVAGWRHDDKNGFFRKLVSLAAVSIKNRLLKENFKDPIAPLRMFKKSYLEGFEFKPYYHRYLNSLILIRGGRIIEIPVKRRARPFGRSNYRFWSRFIEGIYSLRDIKRLKTTQTKPGQSKT